MLDPLNGIGLAASIVQFLEFVGRVVADGYSAYQSHSGATEQNTRIEIVVRDLHQFSSTFQVGSTGHGLLSDDEQALHGLRVQCYYLAEHLLTELEGLKVRSHGRLRSFVAMGKAVRGFLRADKIARLQRDLSNIRAEINSRLLNILV